MKIVKCGKCGAQFDVAAMKPGAQFACGKCRAVVHVPSDAPPATVALSPDQMRKALEEARAAAAPAAPAAAPPKAQPKLPPAMQARAKSTPGTSRAAGAAPAPAPTAATPPAAAKSPPAAKPPSTSSRRRETAGAAEAPEKKSPAVLYAAIGGVVVLGAVGFFVFSGKGGGNSNDAAKAPEPTKPAEPVKPVVPPKPKDPTNFDDFLSMSQQEQHDSLLTRFVAAQGKIGDLEALFKWLTDPKVAANGETRAIVDRVIAEALKLDGNSEWVRNARGDHRVKDFLDSCVHDCIEAFRMPEPEEKLVLDRQKTADSNPWADAPEWMKLSDAVAKVRARNDRLKKDPRFLMAEKKVDWIRTEKAFKDVELTRIFKDPYVIFQEVRKEDVRSTKRVHDEAYGADKEVPVDGTTDPAKVRQNEEWARKGKLFAERDAIIFTELNRRFRELFAAEYKLPTLEEKGRMLTGLVMWNRASFDKLVKEAGNPVGPGTRAFYSPPQQKIFHYLGEESLQELDEIPCEGGYVQKQSDQVTFHEGTHQLQHEYSAIYQGTPLADSDTKVADRKAMWFEEGIAEFMGATEVEEGKTEYLQDVHWRHNRILLDRIQESRMTMFKDNVEKWTIKEFLKPNNNQDLATVGAKLVPTDGNMGSHFYCRVWAFCHFLWYYDGGKYRQKFLDYFRLVMAGTQSSEKFATKIMKRPNQNDWGQIELEYEWYWTQLVGRYVDKDKLTGKWPRPSTDAPTGKVEDDQGFLDYWKESHQGVK